MGWLIELREWYVSIVDTLILVVVYMEFVYDKNKDEEKKHKKTKITKKTTKGAEGGETIEETTESSEPMA